jgi:hypothetical protein
MKQDPEFYLDERFQEVLIILSDLLGSKEDIHYLLLKQIHKKIRQR